MIFLPELASKDSLMNLFPAMRPVVRCLALSAAVALIAEPAAAQRRGEGGGAGVYRSRITPHWFDAGQRFWYQNDLPGGAREFILVDAERGTRERAFDHD